LAILAILKAQASFRGISCFHEMATNWATCNLSDLFLSFSPK
jgi:hypothetical protein